MSSVKEYFTGLGKGVVSLLKGMEVTGKEFVTKKVTEEYPDNRDNLPIGERFRGTLEFIYDENGNHKCIACGLCQMSCPNGTIHIESKMVELPDGKKKKVLVKYNYDLGSCTFCQCVSRLALIRLSVSPTSLSTLCIPAPSLSSSLTIFPRKTPSLHGKLHKLLKPLQQQRLPRLKPLNLTMKINKYKYIWI